MDLSPRAKIRVHQDCDLGAVPLCARSLGPGGTCLVPFFSGDLHQPDGGGLAGLALHRVPCQLACHHLGHAHLCQGLCLWWFERLQLRHPNPGTLPVARQLDRPRSFSWREFGNSCSGSNLSGWFPVHIWRAGSRLLAELTCSSVRELAAPRHGFSLPQQQRPQRGENRP